MVQCMQGLSPVCINARYKTHELDYVLKDSGGANIC